MAPVSENRSLLYVFEYPFSLHPIKLTETSPSKRFRNSPSYWQSIHDLDDTSYRKRRELARRSSVIFESRSSLSESPNYVQGLVGDLELGLGSSSHRNKGERNQLRYDSSRKLSRNCNIDVYLTCKYEIVININA
jgi:hypothetical protein